jgi:hypothetical protein
MCTFNQAAGVYFGQILMLQILELIHELYVLIGAVIITNVVLLVV